MHAETHRALRAYSPQTISIVLGFLLASTPVSSLAQDRLKTMPGYERYQKMSREMTNAAKLGTLSVTWKDGGKAFEFQRDGKRFRYDIASLKATEVTNSPAKPRQEQEEKTEGRRGRSRPSAPARGRQYTS